MTHPVLSFPGTPYPALRLPAGAPLVDHLTVRNSPVLFGCRTGICGICQVQAIGDLPPPLPAEQEVLEVIAPGQACVRLACQIHLNSDLQITVLDTPMT